MSSSINTKKLSKTKKTRKHDDQLLKLAYTRPSVELNAIKERRHIREATRGVVELFNAVRQYQKSLEDTIVSANSSKIKRNVLKKEEKPIITSNCNDKNSIEVVTLDDVKKEETDNDDDALFEGDGDIMEVDVKDESKNLSSSSESDYDSMEDSDESDDDVTGESNDDEKDHSQSASSLESSEEDVKATPKGQRSKLNNVHQNGTGGSARKRKFNNK